MRCDVSWDGRFMVFFATNYARPFDSAWTGVCNPPWLKTMVHCANPGTYGGGGIFVDRGTLVWSLVGSFDPEPKGVKTPFGSKVLDCKTDGDSAIHRVRLARDGWVRGDDAESWSIRPTSKHPELRIRYVGYFSGKSHSEGRMGYVYEFSLEGRPDLFTRATEWATWDANGDLLWAEKGWLHRAHSENLLRGEGPFQSIDLNGLKPPEKQKPASKFRKPLHVPEQPYVEPIVLPPPGTDWP
ncbi:hypothetical protein EON81_14010 [bacterium]|nr:MAG: hypothetical protein EON81_14010 [bacterium]